MIKSILKDYSRTKAELKQKDKEFKYFKLTLESEMDRISKEHKEKSKRFKTKFSNYSK